MTAEPAVLNHVAEQRKPFRRSGMGYVWEMAEHDIVIRADYLSNRSEEMHAEIEVTRGGRHLHMARFNLSSTQSRNTLAKQLDIATKGLEIPWPRLVEQFSVGVMRGERQGEPTQYTSTAERRRLSYLVDHLIIRGKSNMLFAPGGAGKGMLCVGLCCAVASRRALGNLSVMEAVPFYFDWEDDFTTFEDRLNGVARGMGVETPRIAYRRMRGLVSDRINEMARALTDAGANLGIIDSFSAAGGTTSERTSWDSIAHRLFDALDLIPDMTWFIIDHVTGDKLNDPAGKAFGCYSDDTEVLTPTGWKTHASLSLNEPVLAFDLADSVCRWEVPTKQWAYWYDGEMVNLTTENTDVLITPNHRMVVCPAWRGAAASRAGWEFVEAGNLSRADWRTPFGNPVCNDNTDVDQITVDGRQYPADAFLRMVGWWIAEGSISKRGVALAQAHGALAQSMLNTFTELGLRVNISTNTNRPPGREHELPMCYMRASKSQGLADWLTEHCGIGAPNKRLPAMVWGLSARQQSIVLEALIDGDGSRGNKGHVIYTTTSAQLADDVQRLSTLLGRGSHIQSVPSKNEQWLHRYFVQISGADRRWLHFTAGINTTREDYHGNVYCLTLPSGAYVTRRNGKIAVQGNSIQKMNRVRNAWEMRSEQEPGSDTVHMRLFDAKWNHTGKKKPMGMRMEFCGDAVQFSSEDPATAAVQSSTLADKMALNIGTGALSTGILAMSLGVPESSIRTELTRNKDRFTRNEKGFIEIRKQDADEPEGLPWG